MRVVFEQVIPPKQGLAVTVRAGQHLRVTDLVNPVDLRDFVLPDLNEYRKAVMMLRLNRTIEEWNIELLYLPWFTPASFAKGGSEYAIPMLDQAALAGVKLLPEKRPARNFGNC